MKFGAYKNKNTIVESAEDDELFRVDVGNNFVSRFAKAFSMKPANVETRLLARGRAAKHMLRVHLGTGSSKIYAGQLIVEYSTREKYKIARYDGLFDTQDMKKWASSEFDAAFQEELKKGNIR